MTTQNDDGACNGQDNACPKEASRAFNMIANVALARNKPIPRINVYQVMSRELRCVRHRRVLAPEIRESFKPSGQRFWVLPME